ncbi:MAG: DSD1 family PLP-dependent enzyme [Pirellulales bacterium]|nr:DSD1 family PLP-dependent enzyme [Pirellulales bacterium]
MPQNAIGNSINDLETPALLLDLDASDRNISRMASFFADRPASLRPHFKNHKCTKIAQRQMAAGSVVGMTCANITEAESLERAGVKNILIANQVVGPGKIDRLILLAKCCTVAVAVDALPQAQAISDAAKNSNVSVDLLIEVDIGMGRCGVAHGEPALNLAKQIVDLPGTTFRGLQAYEGHCVYIDDSKTRTQMATQSMLLGTNTREIFENSGIKVGVVSGCSSSTYKITGCMDGVDEVQAGTYATMDWRYHELVPEFEIALSLLTTVISCRPDQAVLDAGAKMIGAEFGLPKVKGEPEVEIPLFGAEEHLVIRKVPAWQVGDKVEVLASHACTTCNLHPQLFVHQAGQVVDVWPIDGRAN